MKDLDTDLFSVVRSTFGPSPPNRIGIAISGGGDSIALMHILSECFETGSVSLFAATVDHGLRPGSADEAARAAGQASELGIPHQVLNWEGWDGSGNLQDAARRARYRLLADWARELAIPVVAVGHTADDQAETVLMRMARAAGVDGLAAMAPRRAVNGITVMRPMLGLTRQRLREYLVQKGIDWVDDPSNSDTRFSRIRARQSMAHLEQLGLGAETLSEVAGNLSMAREALDWYAFLSARDIARVDAGDVVICLRRFRTLPEEIARRILVRALTWINGAEYPPRRAAIRDLLASVKARRASTLGGCQITRQGGDFRISREFQAVRRKTAQPDQLWDGRWRVHGGDPRGVEIRALGKRGLNQCENWRQTERPHSALMATPAVWKGSELVAAPLAGRPEGWQAELVGGGEEFFASLLSH